MNILTKGLYKNSKWGRNMIIRGYAQQQAQPVDNYNSILQSGLESSSLGRIEIALREMNEKGIKANHATRLLLIEYANQQNDLKTALKQFEELNKNKEEISDGAYSSLLRNILKNKDVSNLSRVFSSIKKPSYKHYELAIKTYSEAGDSENAFKLFQEMKKQNININSPIYASLMKLSSSKKDQNTTLSLWKELKEKSLNPNLHHFDSLLFLYNSLGDSNGINQTLKEIQHYAIFPQSVDESQSFAVSFVKKILAEKKKSSSTPSASSSSSSSSSSASASSPSSSASASTPKSSAKTSQGYQSDPEKKKPKKK